MVNEKKEGKIASDGKTSDAPKVIDVPEVLPSVELPLKFDWDTSAIIASARRRTDRWDVPARPYKGKDDKEHVYRDDWVWNAGIKNFMAFLSRVYAGQKGYVDKDITQGEILEKMKLMLYFDLQRDLNMQRPPRREKQ